MGPFLGRGPSSFSSLGFQQNLPITEYRLSYCYGITKKISLSD